MKVRSGMMQTLLKLPERMLDYVKFFNSPLLTDNLKLGVFLYHLVKVYRPRIMIETGVALGTSTSFRSW